MSCCNDIMNDPTFLRQLDDLYEQQKQEFHRGFPSSAIKYWQSRDFVKEREMEIAKFATDPTYKMKNLDRVEKKRAAIMCKHEVFSSKPWHVRGGSKRAQAVTDIAHKISVTQVYDQTKGRTGHQIQRTLPNGATKEQIIKVLAVMRDSIPSGQPAIFTIHKDVHKQNLHVQGWVSSKRWDEKTASWHERPVTKNGQREFAYFETAAGLHDYRSKVEKAMTDAGLKFPHADDKSLPRVTDTHPFVQVLLKSHPKEDFISGEVKNGIRSEKVRAICDQIGARAKAIIDKLKRFTTMQNAATRFSNTLASSDETQSIFRPVRSFAVKPTTKPNTSLDQVDPAVPLATSITKRLPSKSVTDSAEDIIAAMSSKNTAPSSRVRI